MVSQETMVGKTLKLPILHLTGPVVAKLFHILVEEVISFKMSGLTSKSVKN